MPKIMTQLKNPKSLRYIQQTALDILMFGDQNKVAEQRRECSPDNCDPSSKLTPAALQHVPQRPPHPAPPPLHRSKCCWIYEHFRSFSSDCLKSASGYCCAHNSFREFSTRQMYNQIQVITIQGFWFQVIKQNSDKLCTKH